MKLPTTVLKEHLLYQEMSDEEQLVLSLIKDPFEFVNFFCAACEDETWCSNHVYFMKNSLAWLTDRSFTNNLSLRLSKVAVKSIQQHFENLKRWIPENLVCNVQNTKVPINSLLFQCASTFWYNAIRTNCYEKNTNQLTFSEVSPQNFQIIKEYAYTGEVKELWRLNEVEIRYLIPSLRLCGLEVLPNGCQEILLRYINKENYFDYLILSYAEDLEIVRKCCCNWVNKEQEFLILKASEKQYLSCELSYITEGSLKEFTKYIPFITHFIAGGEVMEDSTFVDILKQCPKLISIDLGGADAFSDLMLGFPALKELILFKCDWMEDRYLKLFCSVLSNLNRLDLTSCTRITATGWGELSKLPLLKYLNVSGCYNIQYAELELILAATKSLEDFDLNDCSNLTAKSFSHLASCRQNLFSLGLNRTLLADANLIQLISCKASFREIAIVRCQNLTEKGLIEVLQIARNLAKVHISQAQLSPGAIELIIKSNPSLEIIIE